jgi:hypothetical protein
MTEGHYKNCVISGEKLDDIGHYLQNSPQNSLWQMAQQSSVFVSSALTATKLLHTRPYNITVVTKTNPIDYGKKYVVISFINQLRKLSEHYMVCLEN